MKRFWTEVSTAAQPDGIAILLDERPLRTPARAELLLQTVSLSEAIAREWASAGEQVDPRAMPMTGLANAAIDRVQPDKAGFAAILSRFGGSDLLCYRADHPALLAGRQAAAWNPLLAWARRRFDVDFAVTAGVIHVRQPAGTAERLAHAVAALDPFRLAALAPLVTIGGSLVAALAMVERAISADTAWTAVTIDEQWQFEHWGRDAEAAAALDLRHEDFMAAARFLELLGDQ